jgi:hopene-associated glycosyltransferase HpnB
MSPAAICLVAVCTVPAIAWAYLLAAHGGYWRTDQRLPAPGREGEPVGRWPSVMAVVPARNEAAMLSVTLPTLLQQEYPGSFGVVLVDDDSSDGTADVAAAVGGSACPPGRLRIVPGSPPPAGWAGKVWAMHNGLRAAGDATYVLFTDADIAYAPGTVSALVRAAVAGDRGLVSQMALLRAQTQAEQLLVPAFVYFFAQLYPFRRVNRPGSATAAAAGGCMLVRRDFLNEAGGLGRIRGARIDDVAFGRLLKRSAPPVRCWLGFATDVRSCRAYPRLRDIWDMVARSAYTQLRYSPAALAGTLAGLLWLYALPPAAGLAGLGWLAAGGGLAAAVLAAVGLAGWLIMAVTYIPVQRLYQLSPWRASLLPLVALLYAAMTADSARRYYLGRGGQWKGRMISTGSISAEDL